MIRKILLLVLIAITTFLKANAAEVPNIELNNGIPREEIWVTSKFYFI